MQSLQNSNRLQTAAALLFAGYTVEQATERSACSSAELAILQDLLEARLIIPQPSVAMLPDSPYVDIVAEFTEIIPVFKGQVHVALLASASGAAAPKGHSGPALLKDYAGLLLQLFKLYHLAGVAQTASSGPAVDEPTLQALLDTGGSSL